MIKSLLAFLNFMHKKSIIHRDIKPENILSSKEDKCEIRILDFNIAKQCDASTESENEGKFGLKFLTHIATPYYQAPEFDKQGHCTEAVDIWGVGLIMFYITCNYFMKRDFLAIEDKQNQEQFEKVIREDLANFDKLSGPGVDLVVSMLQLNPEDRLTAEQALDHEWF